MTYDELEAISREILDAIKRQADINNGHAGPEAVISQTSLGRTLRPLRENRWHFDRLKDQHMIEIVGENAGGGFGLELAPKGYERLSVTEAEYQRRHQPASSTHFTTTIHGDVGQLAQTGAGSTVSQSSTGGVDFQQFASVLDRLIRQIKADPEIPDNTKQSVEVRADELKTELQNAHPSSECIKTALAWLNTLGVTYSKLEPLVNAVCHAGRILAGRT